MSDLEIENVPALKGLRRELARNRRSCSWRGRFPSSRKLPHGSRPYQAPSHKNTSAQRQIYNYIKTKIQLDKDKNTTSHKKYNCTKAKIQLHTKNTTAQRQKYNYTNKKWKHSIPKTQPREHQQAEYHLLSMFVFKRRILNDSLQITQKVLGFCVSDTYIMSLRGQYS